MKVKKEQFNRAVTELGMEPFFPKSINQRAMLVFPFVGEKAVGEAVKLKTRMDKHGVVSKVIINAEDK